VLDSWRDVLVVPVPNRGNLNISDNDNWCRISLLDGNI